MAILGCIPRLRRRSLGLGFSSKNDDMLDALPNDIIEKILSKLPADQVLRCRAVCKRWQHVIDDPHFAEAHTSENKCRGEESSVTIFQCRNPGLEWPTTSDAVKIDDFGLHLVRPRCNKKELRKRDIRRMGAMTPETNIEISLSDDRYYPTIQASCDGLIIFGSICEPSWRYFICNLVTRESGMLAKLSSGGLKFVCGFYFHPRKKEYRLLCATPSTPRPHHHFRYYTCGLHEESPTELGVHPYKPCAYTDLGPVVVEGFLHNMVDHHELQRQPVIMVLDLDTEELSFMPLPHPGENWRDLHAAHKAEGGRLCICRHSDLYTETEVWLLEDRASWSWVMIFSTQPTDGKHPLFIDLDGGVLLAREHRHGLVRYDMRTGARKSIITEAAYPSKYTDFQIWFPATTCKLSLISLRHLNI